jgi:signal transduction histidine kinase
VHEYRQAEQGVESAVSSGSDEGTQAITALVDSLRPLDRAKTDLLRTASHQLRTPLTCIVGFVELLADGAGGPITAEQERILQTLARNVSRLASLVDALEPDATDADAHPADGSLPCKQRP